MTFRPRRSAIYVSASNRRVLKNAKNLSADITIIDLEDSVAPAAKLDARNLVLRSLIEGEYAGSEIVVRVNALDTPWGLDDLRAVASTRADAVLVPKISSAADVLAVQALLGEGSAVKLWVMMETATAMLAAREIAAARTEVSRLAAMVMGTNDLAKETRARLLPGRATFLPWLTTCLVAARSTGLDILDGVFNDWEDLDGFEDECQQSRDIGFDGKTLVHPCQIEPCNRFFLSP